VGDAVRAEPSGRKRWQALALWGVGLAGGGVAVVGSVFGELTSGMALMLVVGAPAIEEMLKPMGVILMMEKRLTWFRSGFEVIVLCVLGAVAFTVLENLAYIYIYQPDLGSDYAVFRFLACSPMHIGATLIFALGLLKTYRVMRDEGRRMNLELALPYYIGAVMLHGGFNLTMLLLERAGILSFRGI